MLRSSLLRLAQRSTQNQWGMWRSLCFPMLPVSESCKYMDRRSMTENKPLQKIHRYLFYTFIPQDCRVLDRRVYSLHFQIAWVFVILRLYISIAYTAIKNNCSYRGNLMLLKWPIGRRSTSSNRWRFAARCTERCSTYNRVGNSQTWWFRELQELVPYRCKGQTTRLCCSPLEIQIL